MDNVKNIELNNDINLSSIMKESVEEEEKKKKEEEEEETKEEEKKEKNQGNKLIILTKIEKYQRLYPQCVPEVSQDQTEDELNETLQAVRTNICMRQNDQIAKKGLIMELKGFEMIMKNYPEFKELLDLFSIEYGTTKYIPLEARIGLKIIMTYVAISSMKRLEQKIKKGE